MDIPRAGRRRHIRLKWSGHLEEPKMTMLTDYQGLTSHTVRQDQVPQGICRRPIVELTHADLLNFKKVDRALFKKTGEKRKCVMCGREGVAESRRDCPDEQRSAR